MILWVVLFVLVVAISFVLAAQSMRDFSEVPAKEAEYGLFLIRNIPALTPSVLDSIKNELLESKTVISFERLFKGGKSALAVFGPRELLLNHQSALDLLELEDYTQNIEAEHISAWEVVIKKDTKITEKVFASLPHFLESEQFWFQVSLPHSFRAQITAIILSSDSTNKHNLAHKLQHVSPSLHKLPKAYSNAQLLDFYQKRSLRRDNKNPHLSSLEVLNLILL